jgi:hypothetical protein
MTIRRQRFEVRTTPATPNECAIYRQQTGQLHPHSRWCAVVTGEVCGATGGLCTGACSRRHTQSLTEHRRTTR